MIKGRKYNNLQQTTGFMFNDFDDERGIEENIYEDDTAQKYKVEKIIRRKRKTLDM